jgi:cytochrome P450
MTATSIPEARGLPLLGNLPTMVRDPIACLLGAVGEHGPLVRVRLGGGGMLLVAHPEDLEHVLQTHNRRYIRGHTVDMIRPMLGNGLPLSDGEHWLRQRRTMQPVFSRVRIATLVSRLVEVSQRYLVELRDGQELSTHYLMMRITRDVIVETMFSGALVDDVSELDGALATVEHYVARYGFFPFRVPLWLPTPDNVRFRRAIATLDRLVYRLIGERRAELAAATPDAAPGAGRDLLDALLRARDPESGLGMSELELRDEVMNIFFAGHETTANLLTWTVLELTRNPHVEARLRDEVEAVLGGRAPEATDLPQLPLVNAVLRETLRLHPAAWLFAREAAEDDELRGHPIAKGTVITVFPYATHRLAEHWPEPERFDPDRFLRNPSIGLGGTKHWAYVPFGAGPHVCIGIHLAMAEATAVLAVLYQHGRLHALHPNEARPRAAATLHVAGGLPARFDARVP